MRGLTRDGRKEAECARVRVIAKRAGRRHSNDTRRGQAHQLTASSLKPWSTSCTRNAQEVFEDVHGHERDVIRRPPAAEARDLLMLWIGRDEQREHPVRGSEGHEVVQLLLVQHASLQSLPHPERDQTLVGATATRRQPAR